MLIVRGRFFYCAEHEGTYTSKEVDAGKLGGRHGGCKCVVTPVFGSEISRSEYAKITSAINNVYHVRFKGKKSGVIPVGDYAYSFRIKEFGDYDFYDRRPID